MKRSRASCAASLCKPLHHGKHTDQLQWTTACRAQCIHCMRAPVHFRESKRVSRSRHQYRMVSEYGMRRRISEDSQASFQHQVRTARARSASPHPSTNSAAHASESSAKSSVEGLCRFSARPYFCTAFRFGTADYRSAVPNPPASSLACRAWP